MSGQSPRPFRPTTYGASTENYLSASRPPSNLPASPSMLAYDSGWGGGPGGSGPGGMPGLGGNDFTGLSGGGDGLRRNGDRGDGGRDNVRLELPQRNFLSGLQDLQMNMLGNQSYAHYIAPPQASGGVRPPPPPPSSSSSGQGRTSAQSTGPSVNVNEGQYGQQIGGMPNANGSWQINPQTGMNTWVPQANLGGNPFVNVLTNLSHF